VNLSEILDEWEFHLGGNPLCRHHSLSRFREISSVTREFEDEVQFGDIGVSVGLDESGFAKIIEFESIVQIL